MKRVVISGLGVISPLGLTLKETWPNVLAGNSGVTRISSFDPSRLPVQIAAEVKGFNPETVMDAKEARRTTRFIQLAVAAAKEALSDAGIDTARESERIGCSIGVGIGAIEFIHDTVVSLSKDGPRRISPFFIPFPLPIWLPGWSPILLISKAPIFARLLPVRVAPMLLVKLFCLSKTIWPI